MGTRATVLWISFLAVVVAMTVATGRSEGASLTVSSADELCTPLAISCTISDDVTVIDDSTLDFGIRRVELIDKGKLQSGSLGMTILCGSFHAYGSTDGAAISAKSSDDDGFSYGGFLLIDATKGCSDAEAHCQSNDDCQLGTCGVRRCARRNTLLCGADADCEIETCLANGRCSESTSNRCLSNADCSVGPCSTQLSCPRLVKGPGWPDDVVPCNADADCDFGVCDRGDGGIDLDAVVDVAGDQPGGLFLHAEGPVILHRSVEADGAPNEFGGSLEFLSRGSDVRLLGDLHLTGNLGGDFLAEAFGDIEIAGVVDARGGGWDGGVIDVEAGGSILVTGSLLASSMKSGGRGGWVDLYADEDVVLDASGLPATAIQVALQGADGGRWPDGSGGELRAVAGRDVIVVGPSRIALNGVLPKGLGGSVGFIGGRDVFLHSIIESSTPATSGEGGRMDMLAGRKLNLQSGSRIDLSGGPRGKGGVFFAQAGEEAVIGGVIDIRGGSSDSEVRGIDVASCSVRVGPDADFEVGTPGGGSRFSGADSLIVEAGATVFSATGDNELRYRSAAHPPLVSGTLTPAAKLILDPNLATCVRGCGDGLPDDGEECDGGAFPYKMGRACRDDCTRIHCGYPTDSKGPLPSIADVLFTLLASISGATCDLRVCDADGSGHLTARDALLLLRATVGLPESLDCPD